MLWIVSEENARKAEAWLLKKAKPVVQPDPKDFVPSDAWHMRPTSERTQLVMWIVFGVALVAALSSGLN